jgi:hypothetical protein
MDPHPSLGQGNAVSHIRVLDRKDDTGKGQTASPSTATSSEAQKDEQEDWPGSAPSHSEGAQVPIHLGIRGSHYQRRCSTWLSLENKEQINGHSSSLAFPSLG